MESGSKPSRRLRRLRTTLGVVAAVCLAGTAASAALAMGGATAGADAAKPTATPAPTAASPGAGTVELRVAPAADVVVDPAVPLALQVEIDNRTAATISDGTVRVSIADAPLTDSASLDAWLAGDRTATVVGQAPSHTDPAGLTSSVGVTLPPAVVARSAAPVIGVRAELLVGGEVVAKTEAAFASRTTPAGKPPGVALAYPLTAPVSTDGLLSSDQLATMTAPGGTLARQLEAVADRPVAVGVDPKIIASIKALGSAAPASATTWLQRLGAISNVTFPLAYGDADLALQSQIGLPSPLAPSSFTDALDAKDFQTAPPPNPAPQNPGQNPGQNPAQTPAASGSAGSTPAATPAADGATPTPTPAPPGTLPTTAELLSWPFSRSDIAWPADGTVHAADLGFFAKAGLTTAILAPGDLEPTTDVSNAAVNITGSTEVAADQRVTPALREATAADTEVGWRSATGKLAAELALMAQTDGTSATILATFDREAAAHPSRVASTLDEIAGLGWARASTLTDAIGSPPTQRALVDHHESDARKDSGERMIATEEALGRFSSALADPTLVTGPARRQLLDLLAVGWMADQAKWTTSVGSWLVAQSTSMDAVNVVQSSPINVISRETGVPATVQNGLPYPVTVYVDVQPSNGRLVVEQQVKVTVEPESRATVIVPVAAGVGNGEVALTVSLVSPSGVTIGHPVYFDVNVQADWEGVGATVIGAIVVLVFGIGIWRNIRRRRRARESAAAEAEADGADTDHTAVDTDTASDGSTTAPPDPAEDHRG